MQKILAHIKVISILLLVLLVIGYVYYQSRNIINGPQLTITSPVNGSNTKQSLITISGIALNTSVIKVNDREVSISENGNFQEKLLLSPGYTIIEIEATDRFGRITTETREVVYLNNNLESDLLLPQTTSPSTDSFEEPILEDAQDDQASTTDPIDLEDI
ncbi:hypothetical protein COB55_00560 [Candidatus Wolfebacteria bacterium]|nr:MAG: hypothetical protein COB55_00560 [Candidatus Wolfebacteria bacterium]